jgi:hypothetical protein
MLDNQNQAERHRKRRRFIEVSPKFHYRGGRHGPDSVYSAVDLSYVGQSGAVADFAHARRE